MEPKIVEVEIDGKKVKVVLADEHSNYVKKLTTDFEAKEGSIKGEAAKATRVEYEAKIADKDKIILEKDAALATLEPLKEQLSSATSSKAELEKAIAVFKLFDGKVGLDAVSDILGMPKYKDIDVSTPEGVAKFKETFGGSAFAKLIAEDSAPASKGADIRPKGGNGGGSDSSAIVTKMEELKGKPKGEINKALDQMLADSKP
jgi:hypothetical protein